MDWGKLREKEDLWLVMFLTSCSVSDAQEKEPSERGDQNQNEVDQKPTWSWGKNLLHVGISGPSLWPAVALAACFTHQSQLQAGLHPLSWKSPPFSGFIKSILLLSPWNYIILFFYLSEVSGECDVNEMYKGFWVAEQFYSPTLIN